MRKSLFQSWSRTELMAIYREMFGWHRFAMICYWRLALRMKPRWLWPIVRVTKRKKKADD